MDRGAWQAMGLQRVEHNWSDLACMHHLFCRYGKLRPWEANGSKQYTYERSLKFWVPVFWFCHCCLVTKSCLTFYNPVDYSPPGSSVHEILQARILEWTAISFSRGSSRPRDQRRISFFDRWILYHWASREAQSFDYQISVAEKAKGNPESDWAQAQYTDCELSKPKTF